MKKFISVIISVAMLVGLCALTVPANAAGSATLTVYQGYDTENEKLTVEIDVSGNTGMFAAMLKLAYNSDALTYESTTQGTDVFNAGEMAGVNGGYNPLTIYFEASGLTNRTGNGSLCKVVFDVTDASADFGIGVTYDADSTISFKNAFPFYDDVILTVSMMPLCTHESTSTVTVDATCTVDGSVTVTCQECNRVVSVVVIPALGHAASEGTITRLPTKEQPGERTYTCPVCGETYTEEIPFIVGDINCDLMVNGKDDSMLKAFIIGKRPSIDLIKADINEDGLINGRDGNLLKQIIVGIFE